jgi:hypothetical protein
LESQVFDVDDGMSNDFDIDALLPPGLSTTEGSLLMVYCQQRASNLVTQLHSSVCFTCCAEAMLVLQWAQEKVMSEPFVAQSPILYNFLQVCPPSPNLAGPRFPWDRSTMGKLNKCESLDSPHRRTVLLLALGSKEDIPG